jgi:hypothetical protein
MRIATAVLLLLLPIVASAGGVSWSFRVASFEEGSPAKVVLRPVEQVPWFAESCSEISVSLRFKREPFWRRTWSRDLVTREKHELALKSLQAASESGTPIRFGSIGTGLSAIPGSSCSFLSNGLAELKEESGATAIYSFYEPV